MVYFGTCNGNFCPVTTQPPYCKYYYYDGAITGTKSSSIVDVHAIALPDISVLGKTTVWNGQTQLSFYGGYPWYWAKIEMNTTANWTSTFVSDNELFQLACAHEIGHAFGLAHNTAYYDSLMYPTTFGAEVYHILGPQTGEINGVRALYGTRY